MSTGSENKTEGVAPTLPPEQDKPGGEGKAGGDGEAGLGKLLAAAREKRGLTRAEVVAETRIPAHYLQMIESSDYGLISDQLYLLPFVRRYSAFLGLDAEEIAMRFVREVQRAEGAPPARMSEPLLLAETKRTHWGRLAAAVAVLAAVIVLYFLAAQRHRASFQPAQAAVPAPGARTGALPPMAAAPHTEAPLKVPDTSVVANPLAPSAPSAAAESRNPTPPQMQVPAAGGPTAAERR